MKIELNTIKSTVVLSFPEKATTNATNKMMTLIALQPSTILIVNFLLYQTSREERERLSIIVTS